MKLHPDEALARLKDHDHGVLCTVSAERGVDAVPCVYAVDDDGYVGVPIDRVKPKDSMRLQRERNLEADPRATLLIEHWNQNDWSQLWWVRAELQSQEGDPDRDPDRGVGRTVGREARLADLLADRYPQYEDQPFERILVLHIVRLTGWAASPAATEGTS